MSIDNSVKSGEWMLPVEALNLFVPGENFRSTLYEDAVSEVVRYGYLVSGHGFLVAKGMKSEVVEDKEIFRIPKVGEMLVGLMNLRGNLIPVFSLHTKLNIKSSRISIVLILGESGNEVGITIDEYPKPIHETNSANELPPYPNDVLPFLSLGISYAGKDWVEFDCHAFFKESANNVQQY